MDERSDADLVHAYHAGEEPALSELVRRYLSPVFRFLVHMIGDADAAEDVAQETFVKAWKHLRRFKTEKSFKTWLFAIAKNTAIDALRKKNPIAFSTLEKEDGPDIAESIADDQPLPDIVLDRERTKGEIDAALAELPPKARTVIVLHEAEDLTFQEIADTLGEPMNTVKSRYRRGVAALRLLFEKRNEP